MHNRASIKAAIVSAISGKTDAGVRVYPARYMHIPDGDLPAVCVFTPLENASDADNLTYKRIVTIAVECIVEDLDEAVLDVLTVQVERALAADDTLGGIVRNLRLRKSATGEDENANRNILSTILSYEAEYYTDSYYNGSFGDLKSVDVDYMDGVTYDKIPMNK